MLCAECSAGCIRAPMKVQNVASCWLLSFANLVHNVWVSGDVALFAPCMLVTCSSRGLQASLISRA